MEKSESSNDDTNSKPWQSYHTVYTNAKAGMDGVDKEKVQRIVYEMSKGSKYFENEERKEAFIRQKIENTRARCAKLSAADISHYQKVADRRIAELEAQRDLSNLWLHVDMDAFYAAVETLSNPSLKGKPMAVGSMSMISTANYEARKYGVRAAMPGFIARKLCPELIFVPTDFEKYTYCSTLTRKVFQRYDPNFVAASLDEAYLDISEVCRERDLSSHEVAEELRRSVFEETGLTCSAGVAANRLLAKVCSDINKPNGQFVLPNDRMAIMTFISSLPIRKIGGIGKVTEHILRDGFGIKTCEEMLQKAGLLCALFPRSSAAELAEMLSTDLQKEGLHGRTVTLKLKTASFEVRTRAVTLQKYICSSEDILWHARKLLKAELPASLRLIGLRVSHFSEEKAGPSDPTQKSITNFVIFGDASGSNICSNGSLQSNVKDNYFANDHGDDFTSDQSADYVQRDIFDSDQLSDFGYGNCSTSENAIDMDGDNELLRAQAMISPAVVGCVSESCEPDAPQLVETSSSPLNSKRSRDAVGVPSEDQFRWVDDYMCSICGVELPPEFINERQEHSDFHLAERLQEECSGTSLTNHSFGQRHIQKNPIASQSRNKKRKSLPEQGKYMPIDKFFIRNNQSS